MFQSCEIYIKQVIQSKRKGLLPFLIKTLLLIFSWGFGLIVFCRNWAFDQGWMRRYYPPVPIVVSVGNIVAGGTGKTPVIHLIGKQFCKNFITAILSRGYRAPVEKFSEPLMLSKGSGPLFPATLCGDEPYLLSHRLPEALIIVGKDRRKASHIAAKNGAQMILLDDGMQHRQIARDFEIVVVNANDPLGKGFYLPRGFLRDSTTSLARAHLIILNHVKNREHYEATKQLISKYTKAPVIGTELVAIDYCDLCNQSVDHIRGKKVGIFCGIGYPEQFHTLVENEGAHVVDHYFVPDHISPSEEMLREFAERCVKNGAQVLLCTEKDGVKLSAEWKSPLPIIWMEAELRLVEGAEHWDRLIDQMKEKLKEVS